MSNIAKAVVIGSVVGSLFGLLIVTVWISSSNAEKRLRNAITAKQKDNQSELDNLQKTISQTAQVTKAQADALRDIVVGNAQARKGGSGSLATFVTEAVPNINPTTFNQLMNVVSGGRSSWTMRQKELLDLKRAHDNLIDTFPSSLFVGGRGKTEVVVVTSDRAEENFKTGKDNDTSVFGK